MLTLRFGGYADSTQWYLPGTDTAPLPLPDAADTSPWALDSRTFTGPFAPTLFDGAVNTSTAGRTQVFDVAGLWNVLKNVQAIDTAAANLRFDGFAHVDVSVGTGDACGGSSIEIVGAKRGNVVTGGGDDYVSISTLSNDPFFVQDFRLNTGKGNDCVVVTPLDLAAERAAGDTTFDRVRLDAGEYSWDVSGRRQTVIADLGEGCDSFRATGATTDIVSGGRGRDVLMTGAGDDVLNGDGPVGSAGADAGMSGAEAANAATVLKGCGAAGLSMLAKIAVQWSFCFSTANDDRLDAGAGNDRLDGDLGNDRLTGGSGADVFVFEREGRHGFGSDTVTDFNRAEGDRIDLSGFAGLDFGDVRARSFTAGGDTYVAVTEGGYAGSIKLVGVTSIQASDFIFA